jgi:hypothetical protein
MKAIFTLVVMSLALSACTTYETRPAPTTTTTTYARPMMAAPVATTSVSTTSTTD